MKVTLIAYSHPMVPGLKAQDLVAYAARVSNPANQMNTETAPKLLAYLKKNQHWSPFEMASATLEIVTTRDIARQILRHRSFSFQEFSQRYAETTFSAMRETRMQDQKNRQNSLDNDDVFLDAWWKDQQDRVIVRARQAYQDALKAGIAKEVARAVLPEGLTESTLYMAGTLRSWLHYIEVRTDPSTQKEHREVAEACRDALKAVYPDLF